MDKDILKPLEEKTLPEKLFTLKFKVDGASHLILNSDICWECGERTCLVICPADVYRWEEGKKEIIVAYEGCLECGTCRVACKKDAIDWKNPRGGFGVSYRFG